MTDRDINAMKAFRNSIRGITTENLIWLRENIETLAGEFREAAIILTEAELEKRGAIKYNEMTEEYELA